MAIKDDLFSTVSPTAVGLKQEPAKRTYTKSHTRKRSASQAERYQISKLLEEHLSPKDENGLISYLNGMTDDKIAKLIGPHISNDTVRNMRQEIFGMVRKNYPRTPRAEAYTRITKLEEAAAMQEKILGSHNITINHLIDMFNKLAEEVGSDIRFY